MHVSVTLIVCQLDHGKINKIGMINWDLFLCQLYRSIRVLMLVSISCDQMVFGSASGGPQ